MQSKGYILLGSLVKLIKLSAAYWCRQCPLSIYQCTKLLPRDWNNSSFDAKGNLKSMSILKKLCLKNNILSSQTFYKAAGDNSYNFSKPLCLIFQLHSKILLHHQTCKNKIKNRSNETSNIEQYWSGDKWIRLHIIWIMDFWFDRLIWYYINKNKNFGILEISFNLCGRHEYIIVFPCDGKIIYT